MPDTAGLHQPVCDVRGSPHVSVRWRLCCSARPYSANSANTAPSVCLPLGNGDRTGDRCGREADRNECRGLAAMKDIIVGKSAYFGRFRQ